MRQTNANLSASDDYGKGLLNMRDKTIFYRNDGEFEAFSHQNFNQITTGLGFLADAQATIISSL